MEANPTTIIKKERLPALQVVRAIAILGVITVHSTSYATLNMLESHYYFLYNFLNIFMKFGTPTFIALSSFVLFYNYMDRPLNRKLVTSFYKRRMLYIVIPYIAFSIFYFAMLHMMYYPDRSLVDTVESFVSKLFTGKAYTHLYFVFINMQFYLMLPLFLWIFKRRPQVTKWLIPLSLIIQWGFIIANKYYFQLENRGSWSLSYFSYYMLGATLGIYYNQLKSWLLVRREYFSSGRLVVWGALWTIWLGAGLTHVYLWYQTRMYNSSYSTLWYELFYNLYSLTSILVLIQIAFIIYRDGRSWVGRILAHLGSMSFGIYLIHPFFLFLYRGLVPQSSHSLLAHAWYGGGFLTALLCSWITVTLAARYLPHAWILFGSLPQHKSKEAKKISTKASLENESRTMTPDRISSSPFKS